MARKKIVTAAVQRLAVKIASGDDNDRHYDPEQQKKCVGIDAMVDSVIVDEPESDSVEAWYYAPDRSVNIKPDVLSAAFLECGVSSHRVDYVAVRQIRNQQVLSSIRTIFISTAARRNRHPGALEAVLRRAVGR